MDACAVVLSAATAADHGIAAENIPAIDFATEVASLRPFLLKRAIHLTKKRELAEDLAQTTLARALQAQALFTPGTNLKGWLATILHHEFYSHHRRAWRSAAWSDEIGATLSSPLGEQEKSFDLQQLACAMNALPDSQREALIAVGLLGFAYEEVATLLDCSVGTVKSRVSRARIALMAALQTRGTLDNRLMPASPETFTVWLAKLETLRLAACARLAGKAANDGKLPSLPKIAQKSAVATPVLCLANGGKRPLPSTALTAAAA